LVNLIVNVDYDIFRTNNLDNWEATMAEFSKHVRALEDEAKVVLDTCIVSLRSAVSGLDLIQNIGDYHTRPALAEHLAHKHESVMKKFVEEVVAIEHEFMKNRRNPPLQRNQPGNIGAICWERLLCQHLKKSVLVFKRMENEPGFVDSFMKKTAFSQYINLMADIGQYEKDNFEEFLSNATATVNRVLKRNLLKLEYYDAAVSE
jgi:dynein heavy chain, axonemal